MTTIGLFYGTNTGFTEIVVDLIVEEFEMVAPNLVTVHDIAAEPLQKMQDYEYLIVGCPTWNVGQLQDDWDEHYVQIADLDLRGKKMAIFGLGDQYGYPENYCDAIGILGRAFAERGADLVGFTSAEGYQYTHSLGVDGDRFMGLALDEDNESEQTPARVSDWVWQLVDEFDLVHLLEPVLA
jgi:flavodoxin I